MGPRVSHASVYRADSSHGFHAAPFKRLDAKKMQAEGGQKRNAFQSIRSAVGTLASCLDNLRTRRRNMREAQEGDRFGPRDEGLAAITPVAGVERRHDAARGREWRAVEPNLARQ